MQSTPLPRTFRFGRHQQSANYQVIRPAGSGDHLMIYTIEGCGEIFDGPDSRELQTGDVLLYRPGGYQSYATAQSSGTWLLAWAHFDPLAHWTPLIQWPQWKKNTHVLQLPPGEIRDQFNQAINEMVACYQMPVKNAVDFALNRLEQALLWATLVARRDPSLTIDPRIRKAMDYLAQNLATPFSIAAAARASGISRHQNIANR